MLVKRITEMDGSSGPFDARESSQDFDRMSRGVVWWIAYAVRSWFGGHGVPKSIVVACGEVDKDIAVDFHRILTHRFHLNLTHPETA
ncbi:hypothetical protein [Burkholderia stagnalis]|uniref:hypothetical protein n=1 Tax=Burkholderia stagnalis TaxID=1503054 RepID=UPI001639BE6F|nr:hypothetical protein [Burkholderia stagnalis]